MEIIRESAPAKFILFGEHAVVYGQPAIAVPVLNVRAFAEILIDPSLREPRITAEDMGLEFSLSDERYADSGRSILQVIDLLKLRPEAHFPPAGWSLRVWSQIPIARGLGSSAAVSIALIKALTRFMGSSLSAEDLARYAFELEKFHHGQPSGIDNTVISLERPIRFQKGHEFRILHPQTFYFVIGDTGVGKKTGEIVAEVARRWGQDREAVNIIFDSIGQIANLGFKAIQQGHASDLGQLMNHNQSLLEELQVSGPELNRLIKTARDHGALGAKLCGAGRGGCMVSLSPGLPQAQVIQRALLNAGAVNSYITVLKNGR